MLKKSEMSHKYTFNGLQNTHFIVTVLAIRQIKQGTETNMFCIGSILHSCQCKSY